MQKDQIELAIDGVKLRLNNLSEQLSQVSGLIKSCDISRKNESKFELGQTSNAAALLEYSGHLSKINHDIKNTTAQLFDLYLQYNNLDKK